MRKILASLALVGVTILGMGEVMQGDVCSADTPHTNGPP